jgi:HlyD family secretion protein
MKQEMFRKSALDSLATPDRLDEAMRITRPRAWVALAAILLIFITSLIWSIFGTLPASVEGQGIIIREGGTFNVVSFGTGVVTDMIDLNIGEPVHRGQVLGRIAQPEMEQQVAAQRKAVRQLIDEQNDLISRVDA